MKQDTSSAAPSLFEAGWFRGILIGVFVVIVAGVWYISAHPSSVLTLLGKDKTAVERPTAPKPTVGGASGTQ
ncbi:hypothetical protein FJZ36_19380 [Candidatus Poribacteria bacterium]|nr:hypothetical protein [Candidatus Poribacteria bacterium]